MPRYGPLPGLGAAVPRGLRWPVGAALSLGATRIALAIGAGPSPLPGHWLPAVLYAAFAGWAVWGARGRWPLLASLALAGVVLVAWWGIRPSNDRAWRPEVAVAPRIRIDGDQVHISGYRNFDYRSREDFSERWEQRDLRLSDLRGVDFFVSYWKRDGLIAHTFLSFEVAGAEPVAISIEIRPEQGEGFAALPGLFRHFELVYVVGDERDVVRVRSNYRDEDVFLYRTTASAEAARRLFMVYAARINAVAEVPEFYHLGQQQLHGQHRPLRQAGRARRRLGPAPPAQRPQRPLPVRRGARRHLDPVRAAARAVADQRRRRVRRPGSGVLPPHPPGAADPGRVRSRACRGAPVNTGLALSSRRCWARPSSCSRWAGRVPTWSRC
ncbi:DUF4105 domain-containing protein [Pseudoxanthomonas sp. NC8]|nr:DUF4105 domain-containing protein [Pseudoxanthomonas sp. NC8]